MIQTKITEPTRTPFNPHGFADATPLHAFYLGLLEKGLINKVLEEGNLEFENQNLFMTIDCPSEDAAQKAAAIFLLCSTPAANAPSPP